MTDKFEQTAEYMKSIAAEINREINGKAHAPNPELGFVLLIFPFNGPEGARTNYVSNASRKDILVALKEIVARFDGQAGLKGRA
jgi:hypothetical protein